MNTRSIRKSWLRGIRGTRTSLVRLSVHRANTLVIKIVVNLYVSVRLIRHFMLLPMYFLFHPLDNALSTVNEWIHVESDDREMYLKGIMGNFGSRLHDKFSYYKSPARDSEYSVRVSSTHGGMPL